MADEPINFYKKLPKDLLIEPDNPNVELHKMKLPFRCCVVAPSGAGKTNWLMNLIKLFCEGKGTFQSIFILTRNADEPLYILRIYVRVHWPAGKGMYATLL